MRLFKTSVTVFLFQNSASRTTLLSFLSLCLYGWVQPSDDKKWRDWSYERYFQHQEQLYQELQSLGIPGACRIDVNEQLAEEALKGAPKRVKDTVANIEHNIFSTNKKNIILYGIPGTGKSSLAQAIAVKSRTPCLLFEAGTLSTEYMNSGVQNLSRILQYAETIEQRFGKPCILIFDELGALTKKHVSKHNPENNIFESFWQKLDRIRNQRIVVIGAMNSIEDLPSQVFDRCSVVEVPLPDLQRREAILSYYLAERRNKYGLTYSQDVTAANLAVKTKGFSKRNLQDFVEEATEEAIRNNKIVTGQHFITPHKNILKSPTWKQERETGTWKYHCKRYLRSPRATHVAAMALTSVIAYNTITNQKEAMQQAQRIADRQNNYQEQGLALQREGLDLQFANHRENSAHQAAALQQSREQFEYQASSDHIAKQAGINVSVLGIPVGPICYYAYHKFWSTLC